MKRDDEVDSFHRKLPGLKINDHLEVEAYTLGNKLLCPWNLDIFKPVGERVLSAKIQLSQLGVGEAVHLPSGRRDPVLHIVMEHHCYQVRTETNIELNPLCPILSSKPDSLETVLRSIQAGSTVGN